MSGPEFTFTVHPRPTSDDPKAIVQAPAPQSAAKDSPAPVEHDRKWDSLRGNLHFLWRYAFGRY